MFRYGRATDASGSTRLIAGSRGRWSHSSADPRRVHQSGGPVTHSIPEGRVWFTKPKPAHPRTSKNVGGGQKCQPWLSWPPFPIADRVSPISRRMALLALRSVLGSRLASIDCRQSVLVRWCQRVPRSTVLREICPSGCLFGEKLTGRLVGSPMGGRCHRGDPVGGRRSRAVWVRMGLGVTLGAAQFNVWIAVDRCAVAFIGGRDAPTTTLRLQGVPAVGAFHRFGAPKLPCARAAHNIAKPVDLGVA
jgi:hypothetical protein